MRHKKKHNKKEAARPDEPPTGQANRSQQRFYDERSRLSRLTDDVLSGLLVSLQLQNNDSSEKANLVHNIDRLIRFRIDLKKQRMAIQ